MNGSERAYGTMLEVSTSAIDPERRSTVESGEQQVEVVCARHSHYILVSWQYLGNEQTYNPEADQLLWRFRYSLGR